MSALAKLQKTFPQVKRVRDAKRCVQIEVTSADNAVAKKKDPGGCALARACVRQKLADGAIIGVGFSWLVKGDTATRYKTPVTVAREITSFDRHQDFQPSNDYALSSVPPSNRMNRPRKDKSDGGPHKSAYVEGRIVHRHQTANIRVLKKAPKK